MKTSMIIWQFYTRLKESGVQWKPEKNSGLNGFRTHDLCDTGALLYHWTQLSSQQRAGHVVSSQDTRRWWRIQVNVWKNAYLNCGESYEEMIGHDSMYFIFLGYMANSFLSQFSLQVKNHVLRYIFRLGDRMKILSIPQLNVTDDKYHTVIVKREGNRASLQIDYNGKVEGTTGGLHKLLNMGGGSFFTGGLPNVTEVRSRTLSGLSLTFSARG